MKTLNTTKEVEEMRKEYIAMWDRGEFEWNHHKGDKLGRKPISPERIWQTFIEPQLTTLTAKHEADKEKAVEAERERIKNDLERRLEIQTKVLKSEYEGGYTHALQDIKEALTTTKTDKQ